MEKRSEPLKTAFWIIGGLMFVIGLPGWYSRIVHGHADANYGNIVVWGLWVAAYIFFIGLSAGAFLVSSLVYVFDMKRFESIGRVALFTALVTLLMALLSIVVDLGHMERAWHVIVYANFKSPMAWMIYLYTFYMVILSLELWFLLRTDFVQLAREGGRGAGLYRLLALGSRDETEERRRRDRRIVKILATIGIPMAIMFSGGVGALFGTVAARPHWYSGLFPILFLLSALVSGGALLVIIAAVFQDGLRRHRETILDLGRLVGALLALDVLFQVSELLIAFRGGIPGHIAGWLLVLKGPFKDVFWVGQLFLGTLVPLALLLLPTRRNPWAVVTACALIVVGIFGLRLNIVIPALAVEEIRGLAAAVNTPRITATYFPSLSEWLLTIGVSGLGMLLFGLGERWLPRERTQEVEDVSYELDKRTGRRRFIKSLIGVTAGGVAMGSFLGRVSFGSKEHSLPKNAAGERAFGREAGEWIPSCCNMCGGQSGILCHVVDGKVLKIEPNHWNPNNYSNISTDFFEGYTQRSMGAPRGA